MKTEWLNVFPTSCCNREIARSVRLVIRERITKLLNCIEQSTKLSCGSIKIIIEDLDTSSKWSPKVFILCHDLADALKNRRMKEIVEVYRRMETEFACPASLLSTDLVVESVEVHAWEKSYVNKLRQYDQKNIRGEGTLIFSLDEKEAKVHFINIERALRLIEEHDPEQFFEIQCFVTHIKIFKGRVLRGDTSARGFGAMWLRIPDEHDDQVGYWIEHIIHELAHLRLEAIFFHDQLVLNPIDQKIFNAPIRDDLRPMRGIFHATFVLIRMKRVFSRLSMAGMDIRFRDRLRLCELQLNIGLKSVFSEHARFSNAGLIIRKSFLDEDQSTNTSAILN